MEAGLTLAPAAYRDLLCQKLADATRRIQWAYSIFWTFRPEQQVLVWGEGYVDGADSRELSIRRSRQLQEIFIAMIANRGVTGQSSEAPAENAMSPQDLTPTEGFYMCSMTCSFATGCRAGHLRVSVMFGTASLVTVTLEGSFVPVLLSELKYRQ